MGRRTKFEWTVLALAAAVLLVMGICFLAERIHFVGTWRVETQRDDRPAASAPADEDAWPDSLLEGEVIDLNTASRADLERLPGIGRTRAQAIVDFRQENGPFESVDDLTRVNGIGPGILAQVRPYVTAG